VYHLSKQNFGISQAGGGGCTIRSLVAIVMLHILIVISNSSMFIGF